MTDIECIVGVDLSGPVNTDDTAMVMLRRGGAGRYIWGDAGFGLDDIELVKAIDAACDGIDGRLVVGLDAPLSYNPGGGDRPADAALRAELSDRGFPSNSVMTPTMTRMIYLTARGMTVSRMLREFVDPAILEVHPTSALLFRGLPEESVTRIKESPAARTAVVRALADDFVDDIPQTVADSDHMIAAAGAALAAGDWARGEPAWVHDAVPPTHPHPVVV